MGAVVKPIRIIAVCGTLGSGKDTIGDYLAKKYVMQHVSAGDVLRTEARLHGAKDPIPREVLERTGDQLGATYGPGPISRRAIEQYQSVSNTYPGGLVISGFRRTPEIETLKANGGVILFIDAPVHDRYERVTSRQRGDDADSFDTFVAREQQELKGETSEGKKGIYILGVKALADHIIENTGTLEELFENVERALSKTT